MDDLQNTLRLQQAIQSSYQGQARHGLVTAVDPTNHAVKVSLQPEGMVTGWLPDPGLACAGLRVCCPCEVGTQVLTVPVEGDAEHPVIVARIFDTVMSPPVSPATGQPVQPGEIGFFLSSGTYLHLSTKGIFIGGDVSLDGGLHASGDVVSGSISLTSHVHEGVTAGSDLSGEPQAQ